MVRLLAGVVAVAASVVSASHGDPWMYTLTGACNIEGGIDGMSFVKQGNTLSGAPYYKAMHAEKYIYYDPDCMTSTDGTPRWIIDDSKPDVTRDHDLDGDGMCNYIARIDSEDTSHPPTSADWTMNCAGNYQLQFLILLEVTTTTTMAPTGASTPKVLPDNLTTTVTSTRAPVPNAPRSLTLSGACAYKRAMNGLTYDLAGTTADGWPFYKAKGVDEYIYHDADCDGAGTNTVAMWVLDSSKPNTTALYDLDGDGRCTYHARIESTGRKMFPTSATWRMYCGEAAGWVSVDLILKEASDKSLLAGSTVISSATRGGITASVAALSLAITRALFA